MAKQILAAGRFSSETQGWVVTLQGTLVPLHDPGLVHIFTYILLLFYWYHHLCMEAVVMPVAGRYKAGHFPNVP